MKVIPAIFLAAVLLGQNPMVAAGTEAITLKQSPRSLQLMRGKTPILVYHTADVPSPKGVDSVFDRSGFIHPLHAPSGGVVTGIHPIDHYHHLGLWHAWVKTEYDGKKGPDFWNLKGRTGRVRHAGIVALRKAGFTVAQEQVAYLDGPNKKPATLLAETLAVDTKFISGANVIDYVLTQKNVSPKPLVFPAYRYGGGIAFRGPHTWNKDNSDYLTSKGLDRTNSHTSRARWVAMFGPATNENGRNATVAILCHPENRDAPQHIRTWNNGKMFFNYVPTQETGWSIAPGKSHILRYRIIVLDGKANATIIESFWKNYTR
tara:strand:- start:127 stop:1080 length:954 start_codon:yes stop_codon:yes gene_type:complete